MQEQYGSAHVLKARLLAPGLCVFVLLLLAAPVYARPCSKFFDPATANAATPLERRACMVEMWADYPSSWKILTSDKPIAIVTNPASGSEIYAALPETGLGFADKDKVAGWTLAAIVATGLAWILTPGLFVLEHLFFTPDSIPELIAVLLISWWFYSTAVRMAWVVPGRIFGFYHPAEFRGWYSIPWRGLYRPLLKLRIWLNSFRYGKRATAKWASLLETMYHVWKPGDIFLGRFAPFRIPAFQPVGIDGERHICIVAGTGSGKTALLMTMLELHQGNFFAVDAGRQMAHALGRRLGSGGNGIEGRGKTVIELNPYSESSHWNPIEDIDAAVARHGRDAAVRFADTLAEALIKTTEGVNEWVYTEARAFMRGLILYVWAYETPENRHIVRVRDLLTLGLPEKARPEDDLFDVLLAEMRFKEDFEGVIAKAASTMESSQGGDSKNHPLTTAKDQTKWLDYPEIRTISKRSDFHCEDLKMKDDLCVFLVAPLTDIQDKLAPWVRALSMMSFYAFQCIDDYRPKHPCLFALDEFPSLGHIKIVETAAPGFRKYGVRLLTITQNIERLKQTYPQSWGGFLGDSECTVWMANDHPPTFEYLSSRLGSVTHKEKIKVERPLIYAHQLGEFLDNNIIVTRYGKRPLRLKNDPYYKALPVFCYEPDRHYGETLPRALLRRLIQRVLELAPIVAKRSAAYMDNLRIFYFEPYFNSRGAGQGGGVVVAVIALLIAINAFSNVPETDGWLQYFGLIVFASLAVLVSTAALVLVFRGVLKDAYATASALVAGNFDGEHPFPAASIKFFVKVIALALVWFAWVRVITLIVQNIESTPVWLALGAVTLVCTLIAIPVFIVGAILASFCIPPLIYGVSVSVLKPVLRMRQGSAGK
jgi:hypothetical protein